MHLQRLSRTLRLTKLNEIPAAYDHILQWQEALREQRKQDAIEDTWIMLQHSHTYTIGKRGTEHDFHHGIQEALQAGVQIHTIPRGGETTYHGPGQIVLYPIINLRSLKLGARAYVETLEDVMIETVGRWGISAQGRFSGRTGVWVGDRKIGAIGVRISSGIASHGLALNVDPDLTYYDRIVPCGQADRELTSMQRELGCEAPSIDIVADAMADTILNRFGYDGIEWLPNVDSWGQPPEVTTKILQQ